MPPLKVHLDTDIGGDIDDLCALALLLRWPNVELTGVTTVAEHDGKRAGYARYVLALAGRADVPVAAGTDVRLGCFGPDTRLPEEARYWPEPVPAAPGPLTAALDLLECSIEQGATIIGIGPFSNLARLEQRQPGLLGRARVCLMGGSIHALPAGWPAWDYRDDYNVQIDPDAAAQVLDMAPAATLVPIEVTLQTALRRAHLAALASADALGALIAHQAEAFDREVRNAERFGGSCPQIPADIINFQHDPLACAVALGWDGARIETLPLKVAHEAGWLRLRVDGRGRPREVVKAVDGRRFDALWLETVTGRR